MFDEIDTGVSGEVSNRMGEIMQTMSHSMQVFSITHLPQVASKGKNQFKVYKEETTLIPKNSSVVVRRIPVGTKSKAQIAS